MRAAIICDDYFEASLEALSLQFQLSEDVAGATFMAAGSSAPELFTSMSAIFSPGAGSVGVGTIVGSAVFNILMIIGLTAVLAGETLQLNWQPLLRDTVFYSISIMLLSVALWDGRVNTAESCVFLLTYLSYLIFMRFNQRILGSEGFNEVNFT